MSKTIHPNENPLDDPVDAYVIRMLCDTGLLSPKAQAEAWEWARPARLWWIWVSRLLLSLGATLVLSGIIFFFAYNWADMGRLLKLGMIEAALLASLVAASGNVPSQDCQLEQRMNLTGLLV